MLINRTECRRLLLSFAQERWSNKFTRVSQEVFDALEATMRKGIWEIVLQHPTVGKTIMLNTHKRKDVEKDSK